MKKLLLTFTLAGMLMPATTVLASDQSTSNGSAFLSGLAPFLTYYAIGLYGGLGFFVAKGLLENLKNIFNAQTVNGSTIQQTIKPTIPRTRLEDLLGDKPEELTSTLNMLQDNRPYKAMGIPLPKGILFYGPPGTGKTAYARAIANKLGANFFEPGSALLGEHYGASSARIKRLFTDARNSIIADPTDKKIHAVIFIDEIDSIAMDRNKLEPSAGLFSTQSTNTLLEELTKEEANKNILFIGATNHKEKIDPSLLRPGRLDKLIEIKKPKKQSRKDILKHYANKYPLDKAFNDQLLIKMRREGSLTKGYLSRTPGAMICTINFEDLTEKTEDFSPAEIKELCDKAAVRAVEAKRTAITDQDFNTALQLMNRDKKEEHEMPFGMYT